MKNELDLELFRWSTETPFTLVIAPTEVLIIMLR